MVDAMPLQFVVNAFENGPFTGNPAAVVPLDDEPSDSWMQSVAAQNNLSETAFVWPAGDPIALRWFTPTQEIPLCGHATLATAHVLFDELKIGARSLEFETLSGRLGVERSAAGYELDFPATTAGEDVEPEVSQALLSALGVEAGSVIEFGANPFVLLDDPQAVGSIAPDMTAMQSFWGDHVVVSAPGEGEFDVVCRVFAPKVGIPEDPATGAAHCAIAPYWCERLGVDRIKSHQASERGGYFDCAWDGSDRVKLAGRCSTFLRGEIER
jgi:PhzF family phenazine biosynthesis protein